MQDRLSPLIAMQRWSARRGGRRRADLKNATVIIRIIIVALGHGPRHHLSICNVTSMKINNYK